MALYTVFVAKQDMGFTCVDHKYLAEVVSSIKLQKVRVCEARTRVEEDQTVRGPYLRYWQKESLLAKMPRRTHQKYYKASTALPAGKDINFCGYCFCLFRYIIVIR